MNSRYMPRPRDHSRVRRNVVPELGLLTKPESDFKENLSKAE